MPDNKHSGITPSVPPRRSEGDRLARAGLLSVVLATTLGFGLNSSVPAEMRELYYTIWSAVMLGGILILLVSIQWVPVRGHDQVHDGPTQEKQTFRASNEASGWWIPAIVLCSTLYMSLPTLLSFVLGILLVVTVAYGRRWFGRVSPFLILTLAASGLMIHTIHEMNLQPGYGGMDLLPITVAAMRHAAAGIDPYSADYSTITPNPFFYLPLQWLLYLPFDLAGVNLRWVNFGAWLAIIGLFEGLVTKADDPPAARVMVYAILFSQPVFQAMDTQVLPMWALLAQFMVLLLRNRLALVAFFCGCLLAASQLMLVVGALTGVYFMRVLPLKRFLPLGALVVGVSALIFMPFVLISPRFLFTVYVERPHIAIALWEFHRNAANSVSLTNLLFHLGLRSIGTAIQIMVVLAGIGLVFLRPPATKAGLIYLMGIVFLCAVALNGQILRYYYYPALLMIAFGAGLLRWHSGQGDVASEG